MERYGCDDSNPKTNWNKYVCCLLFSNFDMYGHNDVIDVMVRVIRLRSLCKILRNVSWEIHLREFFVSCFLMFRYSFDIFRKVKASMIVSLNDLEVEEFSPRIKIVVNGALGKYGVIMIPRPKKIKRKKSKLWVPAHVEFLWRHWKMSLSKYEQQVLTHYAS